MTLLIDFCIEVLNCNQTKLIEEWCFAWTFRKSSPFEEVAMIEQNQEFKEWGIRKKANSNNILSL